MTTIDKLITGDLAALATDARRDVPAMDTALRERGVYRDGHAGAQARRDALAEERRLQLALMPLAIAQVFAHRVARAATGAAAIACAAALVMLLADPMLMRLVLWLVPGLGVNLGICMMAACTVLLVTYVGATWAAETWFTRRMREAIATHSDVYADLDHLSRGPIEVAQKLVRKIDGWSVGLAFGGAVALSSVFGYLLVMTGAFAPLSRMLSTTALFAERAAAGNLGPLIYGLGLATAAAVMLGRGVTREHRLGEPTSFVVRASRPATLAAGVMLAVIMLVATTRMIGALRFGNLPTSQHRYLLAIGAEAALLLVSAWTLLWWRRREQKRLGD